MVKVRLERLTANEEGKSKKTYSIILDHKLKNTFFSQSIEYSILECSSAKPINCTKRCFVVSVHSNRPFSLAKFYQYTDLPPPVA